MKHFLTLAVFLLTATLIFTSSVRAEDAAGDSGSDAIEICYDGIDNDGDGLADCADDDCAENLLCIIGGGGTTEPEAEIEICYDGIDNDKDGLTDCKDSDCAENLLCLMAPPEDETCRPQPTGPSFFFANTSEEINALFIHAAPVFVDQFSTEFLQVNVNIPCYDGPIDVFIALEIPDGRMLFIEGDGLLARDFKPFRISETAAVTNTFIYSSLPKGTTKLYWLISPTIAGNFWSAFNLGLYDLGGHPFNLNVTE